MKTLAAVPQSLFAPLEELHERPVVGLVGAPLDRPVVTYCTGGVRSAFVAAALTSAGYVDVRNYAGSWWEYAATELPVE